MGEGFKIICNKCGEIAELKQAKTERGWNMIENNSKIEIEDTGTYEREGIYIECKCDNRITESSF